MDDKAREGRPETDFSLLIALSDHVKRFYDHRAGDLEQLGATGGHLKIIHFLADHDGCSQQEIVDASALSRSTISEVLSQMEGLGFIKRGPDAQDRRLTRVFLTKRGKAIGSKVQTTFRDFCLDSMAELSREEFETFARCLGKIAKRIDGS
jgi:DNA-binding MarR family transcriptional regulator